MLIKEAILHEIVLEFGLVSFIEDSVEELKLFAMSALPGLLDLVWSLSALGLHVAQDVSSHFELATDVEKFILFFLFVPIEVTELNRTRLQQRIDEATTNPPGQVW